MTLPHLSPSGGTENTADPESLPSLRPTPIDLQLQALAAKDAAESKNLKTAVVAAALFHILLLAITFPELVAKPDDSVQRPHKAFVVQQVRFKPPAPRRAQEVPKRQERRIPIPDPTPEDPEPILIEDLPLPDLDFPETDAEVFGIPDAPPAETFGDGDVMQVGGGVTAPEKIFFPQPRYTEEARKGRIQGTVILQAIITASGEVSQVRLLKGLTLGLSESAIETVKEWRFKPAMSGGEPVAVYLNLLINFSLQ